MGLRGSGRGSAGRSLARWGVPLAMFWLSAAPVGATVIQVTTLLDQDAADGDCSFREALIAANTDTAYRECAQGSGPDEIELAVEGSIVLLADLPQVLEGVTVRGLGPAVSVIDAGGVFELFFFVDGAVGNGEILRLEGLTLTGGMANNGGVVFLGRNRSLEIVECHLLDNHATIEGGAIRGRLSESISVERSWFAGNTAAAGGGLALWGGSLDIVDTTFSDNHALGGNGGGFYALLHDELLLLRSTLAGNTAVVAGGGAAIVGTGPVVSDSSTVTGNTADSDDIDDGSGGGISFSGGMVANLVNTLVAGNIDGTTNGTWCPDLVDGLGALVVSLGFNLIGTNECLEAEFPAGSPNISADYVGTPLAPIAADLEALDFIGGLTPTMMPLATSHAIDLGTCPGALVDQRGFSDLDGERPVDDPAVTDASDGCDIGAVERGAIDLIFADGFESGDWNRWSAAVL